MQYRSSDKPQRPLTRRPHKRHGWLALHSLLLGGLLLLLAACGDARLQVERTPVPDTELDTSTVDDADVAGPDGTDAEIIAEALDDPDSPVLPLDEEVFPQGDSDEDNVTIDDIVDNTEAHLAERVIVRGRVEETIGEAAFWLEEETLLGENILVIWPDTDPAVPIVEGTVVVVTGGVRYADSFQVQDYEPLELLLRDLTSEPVLVASSVTAAS
ncbi:MAG: hypothetical protein HC876_04340 [Chloroflexaceae bacterium]|nr:hypothetical protein [Chloroflexaceae bacterium]NJO04811.1 hypothetical protein [Chloroflexaceae bacterium]